MSLIKRIKGIAAALLLLLPVMSVKAQSIDSFMSSFLASLVEAEEAAAVSSEDRKTYQTYSDENAGKPAGSETVVIDAYGYAEGSGLSAERQGEYKDEKNVVVVSGQEDRLVYTADIPSAGCYQLALRYYPLKLDERPMGIGLLIDGEYPFKEASLFYLNRVFTDETAVQQDEQGNEYAPRQIESFDWYTMLLKMQNGLWDDPVQVYLEQGVHEITLETLTGAYALDSISLVPAAPLKDFKDYSAEREDTGGKECIKIEAESAVRKSDQSLRPTSDRTGPLTTPYHVSKVRMNMISSSWAKPGQWLEWDFTAPTDGYYYLGFRYQQFYNINFFVTRRLFVDGEIPFKEAGALCFDYNLDWRYKTMTAQNSQEPLKVYLTKGDHTLRMEVILGPYDEMVNRLDSVVTDLNSIYRQIIVLTGVQPDKYQDYYLDKEIPELTDSLRNISKELGESYLDVQELTGSSGAQASILNIFKQQIDNFIQNPETIPAHVTEFKNNIGSLAAWLLDLKKQPMDFDYIYLYQKDAPQPKAKANVFDVLKHEIGAFVASFMEDYNVIDASGEEGIEVWVGAGREQAQIVRMMVNDLYVPRYKKKVQIKLVGVGITEAFLSGKTPDIALTVGRGQPLNLAVRGALVDLTQFDDFKEVSDWFLPASMDPYYFLGGCFGIPDTQEFYMMFYRTDVFREIGVEPPQTWEDLYAIAPDIQRRNMEIGIPYATVDAAGAVDSGMSARNIFPALLMQHGGAFYNKEKSGTELGSTQALDAFLQWTDMYKEYGLALSYNFFNRFRTGEIPLAIAPYTQFAQLEAAAPEISGQWAMLPIPGIRQADGSIDRSQAGWGTAGVILSKTKKAEDAWSFLKWYSSAEAQTRYAKDVEAQMGLINRIAVANTETLAALSWKKEQLQSISLQSKYVKEVSEVLGGYYLSRGLDNAFRDVVYEGKNAKEALTLYNKQINSEIKRKRKEFGLE